MTDALPWFRLYTEMVDNEKLRLLAFEDRWHFVALLCLKGSGVITEPSPLMMRKVAVKMGLDVRSLEEVARRLAEVGLIEQDTLQPLKWSNRQMRSDSDSTAAERKRKQREKEKLANQSLKEGHGRVTDMSRVTVTNVTATDIDRDTDKEIKEAKASLSSGKPEDGESGGDSPDSVVMPENLPACSHMEVLALFAENLPELPQPKPELWDGQRAKNLTARWRWVLTAKKRSGERYATNKAEALDFFNRFFGYVAKSDFLTGRDGVWSGCDLAWLVKAENFAKVFQGNYENKEAA